MSAPRGNRCVFVGNIPYDATEQQLVTIFSQVGPVVGFRLMTDRETGKPRGYGFCEYRDSETALSAMRNLMDYDLNGRKLRVDFAENDKVLAGDGDRAASDVARPSSHVSTGAKQDATFGATSSFLVNSMYASEQLNSSACTERIQMALSQLDARKLLEALSFLKQMAEAEPEKARVLLMCNPALTEAAVYLEDMLKNTPEPEQVPGAPPPQAQSIVGLDADQGVFLQQVIGMTPEQINELPAGISAHIRQLQAQVRGAAAPMPYT